jgi:hypothetical protein
MLQQETVIVPLGSTVQLTDVDAPVRERGYPSKHGHTQKAERRGAQRKRAPYIEAGS